MPTGFALHGFCKSRKNYIDEDLAYDYRQARRNLEKELVNLSDSS